MASLQRCSEKVGCCFPGEPLSLMDKLTKLFFGNVNQNPFIFEEN